MSPTIAAIAAKAQAADTYRLTIDLINKTVSGPDGVIARFDLDEFRRQRLLKGLDDIALTLEFEPDISEYEQRTGFASRFAAA